MAAARGKLADGDANVTFETSKGVSGGQLLLPTSEPAAGSLSCLWQLLLKCTIFCSNRLAVFNRRVNTLRRYLVLL